MTAEPRTVAECWMEEVWRKRDLEAIDRLHAPDFRDRSLRDRAPGPETLDAYKADVADFFRAFPDFVAETEELLADEASGRVAVLWTAGATHQGEFLGAAPTGKRIRFEGIEVLWIEAGRIARRWGEWNGVELLAQLRGG